MTKTKTEKVKEEVIDLAKPKNITDSELLELQKTISAMDKLTVDIGRMEVQKAAMLGEIHNFSKIISDTREDFLKTYGTDNINIQTGEIGYAPETTETPEAKENGEVNS